MVDALTSPWRIQDGNRESTMFKAHFGASAKQINRELNREILVERLFETLVSGDRPGARQLVNETFAQNVPAATVLSDLFWPAHEMIENLFRNDQMTTLSYQLSTRLLRQLVDQVAGRLTVPAATRGTVFACCGPSQGEELAAQIAVDLLESQGYSVTFTGGGIPSDEIIAQVQERRPTFLLLFASAAADLPGVREVVDTLREINATPDTRIIVGGGVFARAEGLADEIGIDRCARNAAEVVELLTGPLPEAERVAVKRPSRAVARRQSRTTGLDGNSRLAA
jgi:methanogenic corrinoid protein MtbC1